jgi:nucleoid-associated protein YgaU
MRLLRCCLVGIAATLVAAAALRLLAPSVTAGGDGFESLLVRGCATAACACAVWGWLCALAVVAEVLHGSGRAQVRAPGVPPALRRLLLAACGVALTATATPALATPGSDATAGLPAVVADLPFPARAMDRPTHESAEGRVVVVGPGDSLWAISAGRLPADADDRGITSAWHELYAENEEVVGDDPSLIHPGQRLVLPDRLEEPS